MIIRLPKGTRMTEALPVRKFGWTPDIPDRRDHIFSAPVPLLNTLPPSVNLTSLFKIPFDQGQTSSCVGNAVAALVQAERGKKVGKKLSWTPSRLFIYWNAREMIGQTSVDAGSCIRDAIKSVANFGITSEINWPFSSPVPLKPAVAAYADAEKYQALQYQAVPQSLDQMRACLANKNPFVIGVGVYASFMSQAVAKTGEVPLPGAGEALIGGHAVTVIGYDNSKQKFLLRNSWGKGWGNKGNFTLPYAYLTDPKLASDIWTITLLEA